MVGVGGGLLQGLFSGPKVYLKAEQHRTLWLTGHKPGVYGPVRRVQVLFMSGLS